MKKLLIPLLAVLAAADVRGGVPTPERIAADPSCVRFDLSLYPESEIGPETPPPAGYALCYIAHYGRHGSRLCSVESDYTTPLATLEAAERRGSLTRSGTELLASLRIISAEARLRSGELTPAGAEQHRAQARRLSDRCRDLFRDGTRIESLSSTSRRCILSMAAFCEELKARYPGLVITHEASERSYPLVYAFGKDPNDPARYAAFDSVRHTTLYRSLMREPDSATVHAGAMVGRIIIDAATLSASRQVALTRQIYKIANSLAGSTCADLDLYRYFTPEELYAQWRYANYKLYLLCGPSAQFGAWIRCMASPVLRYVISCCDRALETGDHAASLRFGHDNTLMALGVLLGVEGLDLRTSDIDTVSARWSAGDYTPAAGNLQLLFYRHATTRRVLVKLLWNENEVRIPLPTVTGPYYAWEDFRAYCLEKMEEADLCYR